MSALRLRGRDIALWLERAVSLYHRIQPGAQDVPLIDPDFPSFNFDMIYGLTCQINLSAQRRFDAKGRVIHPRARRITDLRFHGQPLRPGAEVVLATNSFRSSGGSGFAGTTPDRVIYEGCKPTREVLENHIRETGIATPPPLPGWRFAPMPGTTVLFDSAPRALDHLSDVANLRIEPVMPQANGFHRFRLHL